MTDIRRYSLAAVVLLVALRLAVGWQLLYEGLWKIDTLDTPQPWTSAGYLRNSVGPMRDTFRNMAGDPDELDWLDYDKVSARWNDWATRFQQHYELDEQQAADLNKLLNGTQVAYNDGLVYQEGVGGLPSAFRAVGMPAELVWFDADARRVFVRRPEPGDRAQLESLAGKLKDEKAKTAYLKQVERLHEIQTAGAPELMVFVEALEKLPVGVQKLTVSEKIVWFHPRRKRLYVDASRFLEPGEKAKLESLGKLKGEEPDPAAVKAAAAYLKAVSRIDDRQKKGMGYFQKLRGALKGNPELLGNKEWQRLGKRDQYQQELAQYEADYAQAGTAFEREHLQRTWGEIQSLRKELTGPVKAMETEMQDKAEDLLAVEQHVRGPVAQPWTRLRIMDTLTILGLTVLGTMLICGLFSRFAAVAAAVMLFSFYLAMPPLPGVPEIPGPDHSFIINKNLIEVIALLALAACPTGLWFGLDRALNAFFSNWRADKQVSSSLKSMVATGDEPDDVADVAAATT